MRVIVLPIQNSILTSKCRNSLFGIVDKNCSFCLIVAIVYLVVYSRENNNYDVVVFEETINFALGILYII